MSPSTTYSALRGACCGAPVEKYALPDDIPLWAYLEPVALSAPPLLCGAPATGTCAGNASNFVNRRHRGALLLALQSRSTVSCARTPRSTQAPMSCVSLPTREFPTASSRRTCAARASSKSLRCSTLIRRSSRMVRARAALRSRSRNSRPGCGSSSTRFPIMTPPPVLRRPHYSI